MEKSFINIKIPGISTLLAYSVLFCNLVVSRFQFFIIPSDDVSWEIMEGEDQNIWRPQIREGGFIPWDSTFFRAEIGTDVPPDRAKLYSRAFLIVGQLTRTSKNNNKKKHFIEVDSQVFIISTFNFLSSQWFGNLWLHPTEDVCDTYTFGIRYCTFPPVNLIIDDSKLVALQIWQTRTGVSIS